MLKSVLCAIGFIFVTLVLMHWTSAGQDNIVEGPPETPEVTLYQQP